VIAVVGGRGFIGRAIVERLRRDWPEVVVVTHCRSWGDRPGHRYGDLLSPRTLPAAISGAEVVIQSANFGSYPMEKRRRGQTFAAFDAEGTERLVAAAQAAGVRRYLFISGAGARSGADKPYWNALRQGETAVLEAVGMEGVCVEPTLVYGARDRGLNRMLAFARRAHFVPLVGSGEELHQPVFVEDVAELVCQALEPGSPQGCFAIGGPERLSMNNLLRRSLTAAGLRSSICHVPIPLARFGAEILHRLPGELLSPAAIDFVREDFVADLAPLRSEFSLNLTALENGLSTYLPRTGDRRLRSL
jgi:nucleoside-diphosphate-sugar epimerase